MIFRRSSLLAFVFGLLPASWINAAPKPPPARVGPTDRPTARPISIMVGHSTYEWHDSRGWVFVGKHNRANHWRTHVTEPMRIEPYEPDPEHGTEMEKRAAAAKKADYATEIGRMPAWMESKLHIESMAAWRARNADRIRHFLDSLKS